MPTDEPIVLSSDDEITVEKVTKKAAPIRRIRHTFRLCETPENRLRLRERALELKDRIVYMLRWADPTSTKCKYFRMLGRQDHRFKDHYWAQLVPEMRAGFVPDAHPRPLDIYKETHAKVLRYCNVFLVLCNVLERKRYYTRAVYSSIAGLITTDDNRKEMEFLFFRMCRNLFGVDY